MFSKLLEVNFIIRESDKWQLTAKGKLAGGKIKTSAKLGNYIEWPENFDLSKLPPHQTPDTPIAMITSSKMAEKLGLTAKKLNHIFSELGWLNKSLKGWLATEHGLHQGALQNEDSRTGIPYVKWPETLTHSPILFGAVQAMSKSLANLNDNGQETPNKFCSVDGHWVNSESEMLIDNWLYLAEITHAYNRKLPIEEEVYCAFYIPTGKVYIEYWRSNLDIKLQAKKDKKLAIYKENKFKLIELTGQDIQNLDEVLPRHLLRFGIQAY
ncbi:MAG: glycerol kinase [Paraglaciecola sp.]|uniref:glycerol kinase n=1 Tax=Paraglaciecola sp. TaxID=1920173 RepID=UPI003298C5DF